MPDEGGILTAVETAPDTCEKVGWGKRLAAVGVTFPAQIVISSVSFLLTRGSRRHRSGSSAADERRAKQSNLGCASVPLCTPSRVTDEVADDRKGLIGLVSEHAVSGVWKDLEP
jgi:hypothetical protein